MVKMKAPFRRGQMLWYTCPKGHKSMVKYVRWWGIMRSALIVIRLCDKGPEITVHVSDVTAV